MIRFCDNEVSCKEYGVLNRNQLYSYFVSGHLDEYICIYDAKKFVGVITYNSLSNADSIDGAIIKEYVILNRDIWQKAKEIFKRKSRNLRNSVLLPVLDENYQLISFAYQDEDANREMRMLRELKEAKEGLQFSDVFPEYKCVKIYGFNELAYFFADYLSSQNIYVQVEGGMWKSFFLEKNLQMLEYECLCVYAEGTWEKTRNWKENLLRSVSVEFECIDKVYETNIKNGIIKDAYIESEELLKQLRREKEVVLCGVDMETQDTYDFLLSKDIEVCCFVMDKLHPEDEHRLFGKKIMSLSEIINVYSNPIFINGISRYSAWGIGEVDYYDYIGYKRNESFILLRDYIDIPKNNLLNVLRNTGAVLTGDRFLCSRLNKYLIEKGVFVAGYMYTLENDLLPSNMQETGGGIMILYTLLWNQYA